MGCVDYVRTVYHALLSMCDAMLGRVLDMFDKYDMWEDTMLIVNTDHGFMMAEHDWWGKVVMPFFQEVAHIPFYIYVPPSHRGGRHRLQDAVEGDEMVN